MGRTTKEPSLGTATPNMIRAACRARFYRRLDVLDEIAGDKDEKAADRVRALDTLGRFGLGAADQGQVHIHAGDGATIIGVVRLPVLGEEIHDDRAEIAQNGEKGHAAGPSLAAPGHLAGGVTGEEGPLLLGSGEEAAP